jgi:hypothetical protein
LVNERSYSAFVCEMKLVGVGVAYEVCLVLGFIEWSCVHWLRY